MSDLIVSQDLAALIDGWLEAEKNGVEFPVDFDVAWQVAGYATKGSGKRALEKYMNEGTEYLFNKVLKSTGGRGSESIQLTCDSQNNLCGIFEIIL
jgi:hypothetical protein